MRRSVVECDICGEEINFDWYEAKLKYIASYHGVKITRHNDVIVCCSCKATLAKMIRNERKRTET